MKFSTAHFEGHFIAKKKLLINIVTTNSVYEFFHFDKVKATVHRY